MSQRLADALERLRRIVPKRVEEFDARHRHRRFRMHDLGHLLESGDPQLSTLLRGADALQTTVGDLLGEQSLGEADRDRLRDFVDFLIKRFDLMRVGSPQAEPATINVNESDFIERDFDYPRPHHVFVVQHADAAGGPGIEVDRDTEMTEVLHSIRDVYTGHLRVIRVNGESMSPLLQNGDKVTIDTRLISPKNGDVVVIYESPRGGIVGYWYRGEDGEVRLEKENTSFDAERLEANGAWTLWGTVTRIVDRPVRPRRR